MADGFYYVAGAGFAFGADHRGAFGDAAERLAQVAAAADEWDGKIMLPDMMHFVGGRQDFGFVHIVHAKGFQYLGFHEVSDAAFRHYGDGNGVDDFANH